MLVFLHESREISDTQTGEHALIDDTVTRQQYTVAWNLVQGRVRELKYIPRHQVLGGDRSPYN